MLQINPHELRDLLIRHPQVVIVDVRCHYERVEGCYIVTSHHIPLYTPDWEHNLSFVAELNKIAQLDAPLVFVCHSGNRSCEAGEIAEIHGYRQVYNLDQGYTGLTQWMTQTNSDDVRHLLRLSGC